MYRAVLVLYPTLFCSSHHGMIFVEILQKHGLPSETSCLVRCRLDTTALLLDRLVDIHAPVLVRVLLMVSSSMLMMFVPWSAPAPQCNGRRLGFATFWRRNASEKFCSLSSSRFSISSGKNSDSRPTLLHCSSLPTYYSTRRHPLRHPLRNPMEDG